MRKVILFMHMSLDGFIDKTNGEMDWVTRDDMEMNNYLIGDLLTTVDTMLLGRTLYQGFQQAWPAIATTPGMPKELVSFAHWIEDSPKYVFSKSLNKLDWKNSFLLKGNVAEEVKKLQQQRGKDIVVFGGSGIAQQLAKENLIDEYRIKLEPIFLGAGKLLFKDMARLKLIQSKAFSSGVVGLYYQPEKK